MTKKIQNWAFIAPKMSSDLGQYFGGILDFVKYNPAIFLHAFTFSDKNISALANMDGIISYTIPPPEVMAIFKGKHPPIVAITMCKPTHPTIAYAHINPYGVATCVVNLLARRYCRSYAFCSSHAPYYTDESAALLTAYRQQIFIRTGRMPKLFRPITTYDVNLITAEVDRFTHWFEQMEKPCGIFVHGDDVARKLLDTCRLKGIAVPEELRVIGTGNSPMFCERTFPTLSSYGIDHAQTASEAARILQRLIRGELTPQEASYEIPLPDVTERASSIDEHGGARTAHEALTFIHAHLKRGQVPMIRDIAFHLNTSIRKIENDFLTFHGHTIRDEIITYRLELLRKALRASNAPIKTLVTRFGFGDISQATRTFKARFGTTMSAYRASNLT